MDDGFEQAKSAFLAQTAAVHHAPKPGIRVFPTMASDSPFATLRVGRLYAFEAEVAVKSRSRAPDTVRGFASPDGEVVLERKKNLGILFREAKILHATPSLTALELAQRVVWMRLEELTPSTSSISPGSSPSLDLLEHGGEQYAAPTQNDIAATAAPTLSLDRAGAAVLTFFYATLATRSQPLGGLWRAEYRCTRDYRVTGSAEQLVRMLQ